MKCPDSNRAQVDQSTFWDEDGINWDAHRIGWAIAGGCAAVTVIITFISVFKHSRNYTNPGEQRQILRILYMPTVYAVISFFSYRYFREYTYYSLIEIAYEAVTLSAFLLLLIEYVAATAAGHEAEKAIQRKDKHKMPMPFCCWRYRPTKPYFMYTVKWSVLQYVIIRPLCSIIGIVCEKFDVLCEAEGFDWHYANAYIEIVDFVSITIALYGLLVFYALTSEELKGQRPLAKFMCIKLIVMVPFYQSFVFSWLESTGKIKDTQYWTSTNIVDGLNALAICIEMIFFSALMMWAYPSSSYRPSDVNPKKGGAWRAIGDSLNMADFFYEIYLSMRFYVDHARGAPQVQAARPDNRADFNEAFGLEGYGTAAAGGGKARSRQFARPSYDEEIRLAPYYPAGGASAEDINRQSPTFPTAAASNNGHAMLPQYDGVPSYRPQRV
ncbi:DUF300-domain-containing protein [Cylindrobasidium torrendii FP15055 ss-10]|uniref:DUF300-domain-containing protein n=1 Tax=Cylindrobasidium torrendii FP15055 ss-10 TaxID=1314674 RepID=A0A0D7AVW2_9AGAR|nr:DUF300-domain-containing protein [Cylindrobasidium torrendii FP15055 ss-10]